MNSFLNDGQQKEYPEDENLKERLNPDPKPSERAGDFQNDAVIQHTHKYQWHAERLGAPGGSMGRGPVTHQTGPVEGTDRVSTETRPRNVSFYFYVRINA